MEEVYDLKQDYPTWVHNALLDLLRQIRTSNHALKNNYTSHNLKLDSMLSCIVVVNPIDKDVICFSGLQIDSWKYPIARVSSRHWFADKYSSKYLRKRINWKMCVAEQIKVATDQGYDKMFFSTELSALDRIFDLQCSRATTAVNTVIPTVKIVPLDGWYDVSDHNSWQRVGQLIINNKNWDFPLTKRNNNGN
jgi:hypothetical protein